MDNVKLILPGERIFLRPIVPSDLKQYYVNWLNDVEVNKYLETRFEIQSISTIKSYVENIAAKKNELLFAICLKENQKHIGNIKLGPINEYHKFAEISLFIAERKQWGKGFGSEAINIISQYAFDQLNLHKLTAGCYENNMGSVAAFQKVGFEIEGIWKDHYLTSDGYTGRICLARFNR